MFTFLTILATAAVYRMAIIAAGTLPAGALKDKAAEILGSVK